MGEVNPLHFGELGQAGVAESPVGRGVSIAEAENYPRYSGGRWGWSAAVLPAEKTLTIFINGQELVSILCTPVKLKYLVLGFLRAEGIITGVDDIETMRICLADGVAEVRLVNPFVLPGRRTITSGCGGGVAFEQATTVPPVRSSWSVSPEQILEAAKALRGDGCGPGRPAGMHVSALSDGHEVLFQAADIGRHNTLDKIWGECMLADVETADRLLVTTGRVSSEMLLKAGRMGVPVVASLNSATRRAVTMGDELGIAIAGYVRGEQLTVYSHPERISGCPVGAAVGTGVMI